MGETEGQNAQRAAQSGGRKFKHTQVVEAKPLDKLGKDYERKVAALDEEIKLEQRMLDEEEREERLDEFFSRRLDGGLFTLQAIDAILAWLAAEDVSLKAAEYHPTSLEERTVRMCFNYT